MEIELVRLAEGLNLSPATVERWIRQGRLPVRKKSDLCIFSVSSLQKWAVANHMTFALPGPDASITAGAFTGALTAAVEQGGVYYDIEGDSVEAVLHSAVCHIPLFETHEQRKLLLERLIAREQMMSTAIGRGVAIPHPRISLEDSELLSLISVCFLKTPIDYHSVDQHPVFVLFVLVCPSPQSHLRLLARLSHCLRDETFVDFLRSIPGKDVFLKKIREIDSLFDAHGVSS